MPKDPNEIGALWARTTKDGDVYYSGTIEGLGRIVVFRNKKKAENHPDFRILKSTDKASREAASQDVAF
jgi:uncharacterized protein (DUF736 family)